MIDRFLAMEWEEAPEAMRFEASLGEILEDAAVLVKLLNASEIRLERSSLSIPDAGEYDPSLPSSAAVKLFVRAPAIVNVMLNHKICVEHDLPLHPTVYYELAEAKRYAISRPISEIERANRLYRESIDLARAAISLDADFGTRAAAFRNKLPRELLGFIYTGGLDKYTWRGSEPKKLLDLARKISESWEPDVIIAAAHGSIMPGLLFAEYLAKPLYFARFSMFKRNDEAPIVSFADEAWLSTWHEGRALLFDEDVARGATLGLFSKRLGPLFKEFKTACSIRHAGSAFKPDFAARTWWD